jgi:spore germination cell wall hydrolase CwlJ-like protein
MVTELACLALAVYYEARSEPLSGQAAVATVVMNRVADPRYPDTICEVVQQGPKSPTGMPLRHQCQFSFYCDGLGEDPRDRAAWRRALVVSKLVINGTLYRNELEGVVHYHATWLTVPTWAGNMEPIAVIGEHIFLRERT